MWSFKISLLERLLINEKVQPLEGMKNRELQHGMIASALIYGSWTQRVSKSVQYLVKYHNSLSCDSRHWISAKWGYIPRNSICNWIIMLISLTLFCPNPFLVQICSSIISGQWNCTVGLSQTEAISKCWACSGLLNEP